MPSQCLLRFKQIKTDEGVNFTTVIPQINGVDIATVNDIPVSWRNAIQGSPQLVGIDTTANINALGGAFLEGDVVIPTDVGVFTLGGGATTAGEAWQFQSGVWVQILTSDGVNVGDYYFVAGPTTGTTLFGGLTDAVDNNAVIYFDGASGTTPTTISFDPDGTARADANALSVTDGTGFMFDDASGVPVNGEWFPVFSPATGVTQISASSGVAVNGGGGPATGAVTLTAVGDGTTGGNVIQASITANGIGWNLADADGSYWKANGSGVALVSTIVAEDFTGLVATVSGDAIGPALVGTPDGNGYVCVEQNGIPLFVGDGVKTDDVYFSGDGGTTARALTAIVAGDIGYLGDGNPWDGIDWGKYIIKSFL